MVQPRHQTPLWESVAQSGTLLPSILILVFKSAIKEFHGYMSYTLFEKVHMDSNILGRWINVETISHTLIIICQRFIAIIRFRATFVRKGQATIGHPVPISEEFEYQLHIYNSHWIFEPNLESSERNTLRNSQVSAPLSPPVSIKMDKMCRPMGVNYLSFSVFW